MSDKTILITLIVSTLNVYACFMPVGASNLSVDELLAKIDSLERVSQIDEAGRILDDYIDWHTNSSSPDKVGLINAYIRQAFIHRWRGDNHESTEHFYEAGRLAKAINDSLLIAKSYHGLGYNHVIAGRYDEGLEAYTTALEIDTRFEDWENVSLDLNAIGKIYEMWRDFEKALEFYYRSLEISEQIQNYNQVAIRQASIASAYKSLGQYDLALEWLEKSLALEIELQNEARQGYRLDQIGEIYTLQGEYEKAKDYLLRALDIFRENHVLASESIVLNHIGLNYMGRTNYDNALKHYHKSLEIAERIGFNNMIQKNYEEISLLHQKSGNYSLALENYKIFIQHRDSAFNERARQQLLGFQVKYETEQKEKELAVANQQQLEQQLKLSQSNQRLLLMWGVTFILLILLGALYNRFRIKKLAQLRLTNINTQLTEVNKTKDKFFNILAHDLKNPIYAFRNISTAVHDNYHALQPEEIHSYTSELKSSATKLSVFLDKLLQWAASQTGRLKPKTRPVALKPLFEELIDLHHSMIESKKLNITRNIDEKHCASADLNMLHTVFRNILCNAIKFTPENGCIKIDSTTDPQHVILKISDSGIGMTREEVKMLFNIDSDTTQIGNSKEKGMGIGLILCKELIDKNNGRIEVDSYPGKGSVFTIVLPVNHVNKGI